MISYSDLHQFYVKIASPGNKTEKCYRGELPPVKIFVRVHPSVRGETDKYHINLLVLHAGLIRMFFF